MSVRVRFQPGLKPIIEKHQDHDQSSHGSWAHGGLSSKEKEIHQRITNVKRTSWENYDKYAEEDDDRKVQYIEAVYTTKDNKKYILIQENIKEPSDRFISKVFHNIEVKAYEKVEGGLKEVGTLNTEGGESGIIQGVLVQPEYQRQGIATAMLNMARTYAPNNFQIEHSFSLTDDAKNWSSIVKHQQHDQQSHGNWASGGYAKIGGAGVDITKKLDEIFADPETTLDLQNRLQAQIDAGQKGSDVALDLILKAQGFNGKPKTTKTIKEINELEKTGEYITVYRGVTDFSSEASRSGKGDENSKISQTATQSLKDFTEGEYFTGQGVSGSGTYTTTEKDLADSYSSTVDESDGVFNNGKTMKILIPKNIKIASPQLVKKVTKDVSDFWSKKFNEGVNDVAPNHENNVGRKLASLGYQAYEGGMSNVRMNYIILDRSAIVVSKEPITDFEGTSL
jgi:hypothetical protein